jgi:hypothetical protein
MINTMDFVTITKIHSLTIERSLNCPQYAWVGRTCIYCLDEYRSLKFKANEIAELMNLTERQIGQSLEINRQNNLVKS